MFQNFNATENGIVLYILILKFLERSQEDFWLTNNMDFLLYDTILCPRENKFIN